ncbi:SGNH hydrolase-type esterase domain-containing protein [Blyttiomyces helicus]|uniref:SGNH hydrolase-type esterase domain-containing protein n=1 Tax=Blyttiomyces helicus TaxID=388810 RepID=A0A4P9WGE5_9FUNG|nr:SGNH hydrolase-type esterase domain-containing protein [Blyttiomyces helicus]|eukprot:RKO91412.1 SGNH hydrolase-type esterase domain-containing protein [Blyttiomyces helicus]
MYPLRPLFGLPGWGVPLSDFFSFSVVNRARAGRSTRSFINDGLWDAILNNILTWSLTTTDHWALILQIEFGHDDAHPLRDGQGVLGTGNETQTMYLTRMIDDVRSRNCTPILSSMTPRLKFVNNAQVIGTPFVEWAKDVANATETPFVDHNLFTAQMYTQMGLKNTMTLFAPGDSTHTDAAGAVVVAEMFLRGLVCDGQAEELIAGLSPRGAAVTC